MDAEDSGGLLAWLVDGAAALAGGGAVGASLGLLGQPVAGAICGPAALLLLFALLRRIGRGGRRQGLPPFALPEWDEVLPGAPVAAKVVRLHPSRRLPSAGEPKPRFDPHAEGRQKRPNNVVPFAPDASAALRAALAETREASR